MRIFRTIVCGVLLAGALSIPSTTAAAAAAAADPPVSDPVAEGLADAYGMSVGDARELLDRQAASLGQLRSLPDRLGDEVVGRWLDEVTGEAVVAVTSADAVGLARDVGVRGVLVSRYRGELARLREQVEDLIPDGAVGIDSWGVDPASNRVVVYVNVVAANGSARDFVGALAALGDGVAVVETSSSPRQQAGEANPGDPWWPGGESNCSMGFGATDSSGGLHVLTAGHCTNDVNQAAYGQSGQSNRIGTSNVGGGRSVNAREGDMGVVAVTEAGWTLSADVNTWGGGAVAVTGSTDPVVGQAVCHSGNTSKWQCGTVRRVNQTIDYGSVVIEGLATSTACSRGGDSGGAWLAGDLAVGLHSGGPSQCVSNPGPGDESIFQPVREALGKWNLTLYTEDAPPVDDDFSLALSPTSVSVAPGTSATVTVNTQVTNGATQTVALKATGLPGGVGAVFAPASVTAGGSSTLTLTVAAGAAAGTSSITVTGDGTAVDKSAVLSLTVLGEDPPGCEAAAWNQWTWYRAGDLVSFNGREWLATNSSYGVQPGSRWDWGHWSARGSC
ncbi:S1 family peptidase [Phytomonospora sp. NPDC050363]|uniref:S1 family peptidase n=1 Tax=Phytomonospora sp. NPDC050363 TaxID=3155642 RepID=UPI0033C1A25B